MALDKKQFRRLIRNTLKELEPEIPYSRTAEELLLLTAAQESAFGTYLEQIKGPAKGVFQMEPNSWKDLWIKFIMDRPALMNKVSNFIPHYIDFSDITAVGNIPFQIVQARVYYWRIPARLPDIALMPMSTSGTGDQRITYASVRALAAYWKEYYNTELGRGTIEQAVLNYEKYVI